MQPVAILGLGCRLPDADDPAAFWANLRVGQDSILPATAASMDRDAAWPLLVCRQALDDAGPIDTARCGVILGHYAWAITAATAARIGPLLDAPLNQALEALAPGLSLPSPPPGPAEAAEPSAHIVATLADGLGLGGPSYAIDAACASFLFALKLAALHIEAGAADHMLVAAANASDQAFIVFGLTELQATARQGRSRPFDARSDGLAPAEGAVAVLLGRHTAGRRVHGMIRGIGLSGDGRGQHLTAPNPKGQLLACTRAYAESGIDPASVAFVECHATGTPVGDRAELDLLDRVFAAAVPPPIAGAAKSNIGHAMTASGGVGLLKTLLAMRAGEIPPTIAIEEPLAGAVGSRIDVARETRPWPAGAGPRRAAVNAFGFGGTNAHLIVDQAAPPTEPAPPRPPRPPQSVTIVGMAAHFGPWADLAEFAAARTDATPGFRPLPPRRWRGLEGHPELMRACGFPEGPPPQAGYIDSFTLDPVHLRMPPRDVAHLNPQQLLMLKVGDAALRDAGCVPGGRVAVIVAMAIEQDVHLLGGRWSMADRLRQAVADAGATLPEADIAALAGLAEDALTPPPEPSDFLAYVGNLMASRISALWDFSAPAFTISAGETAVARAIDIARQFLASGEADAVLVGAVDLACGFANLAARQAVAATHAQGPPLASFGFDAAMTGWRAGEGAGAVVLTRPNEAAGAVYAHIDAVALGRRAADEAATALAERTARVALAEAGLDAGAVGYLEAAASGVADADLAEMRGLTAAYADAPAAGVAVGSVAALTGHCGVAAGMAGLIGAALSVAEQAVPGTPGWSGPRLDAAPFHVPTSRRPWLGRRRHAALHMQDGTRAAAHLVLSATPDTVAVPASARRGPRLPFLVPVHGDSAADIVVGLERIGRDVRAGIACAEIERRAIAQPGAALAACLVARDATQLAEEAERMADAACATLARAATWRSPRGSCIAGVPLGPAGTLAFVYSGMHSAYPGLARQLPHLAPDGAAELSARFADPAVVLPDRLLWPPSLRPPSPAQAMQADEDLSAADFDLLGIGVTSTFLATRLLRHAGVEADICLGYSLGEISMLFATGAWELGDAWVERLRGLRPSLLRLCEGTHDSFLVAAPAATVEAALGAAPKAEIVLVNSPRECVLVGDAAWCAALLERLGADYLPLRGRMTLHGAAARAEHAAIARCFAAPFAPGARPRLLLGDGEAGAWNAETVGDRIAETLVRPVDFPALAERAWQEGTRLFIEIGPGNACTRWIGETLAGRPHAAMAITRRGVDETTSVAQLAAWLVAHRRPVDLTALLDRPAGPTPAGAADCTVTLGGPPIAGTLLANARAAGIDRAFAAAAPEETPREAPTDRQAVLADIAAFQSRGHLAFLRARSRVIAAVRTPAAQPTAMFTKADILEIAEGRISAVFGPDFAAVDDFSRRVRVPGEPFTTMSRVTHIEGQRGSFAAGRIVTEFDIPPDAWFAIDGHVASLLALDAQGVLFLLSWLGVDLESRGARRFRWLDATITMLDDLPRVGETLRFDIRLTSAFRDGESLILTFDMEASCGGRPLLRNEACRVGFFTDAGLATSEGIRPHHRSQRAPSAHGFASVLPPPAVPPDGQALLALTHGDLGVLSPAHASPANPSLRLPPAVLLMVDRVLALDLAGGACGLGLIVGERRLDPMHWAIRAHFKDDPVFPGPCMLEGAVQLMKVFALASGLHAATSGARFELLTGRPYRLTFREQVLPAGQMFTYRVDIVEIGLHPAPYLVADVGFEEGGKTIGLLTGIGLRLAADAAAIRRSA